MNKEELKKYVDGLDDQSEIIVITKKEQTEVIPKHCERVDIGDKIVWVLKKLRDGAWVVVVAWVLQCVEDFPKPQAVFLAAKEKIESVVKHVNYDFPYRTHDNQYPIVAFEFNGTTHYVPPSGLSPDALAETGIFGVTTRV